ncbi:hypothetical protein L6164_024116 [Bauhinia variegata]|uniref:Uncharacterized protein n=1 Tax=Bauhinia variegata TaxID=167791 RepID=A0ACB9LWI1_BAUVA|nr:hypothetical protein L6164_024116 [Bauhinia variegata]
MEGLRSLLSSTEVTTHSRLVDFQNELVNLQVIEDDPKYWEVISSSLAVGWLDIVVKMLAYMDLASWISSAIVR